MSEDLHGEFKYGDRVQLTGPKNRMHSFILERGGVFHTHKGLLPHSAVVGLPEGSVVSNGTDDYLALRPLLRDFVMSMPRGATIIYPKDSAQILMSAGIAPGSRVLEAGAGSGALSLSIIQAIGSTGELISFERREEFARVARANVLTYFGHLPENWRLIEADVVEGFDSEIAPASLDKVILDLLAPWDCVSGASKTLKPGGVLLCYVATVTQLSRVVEAIRDSENFTEPESSESLVRTWHVEGLAVRPDHRMVAHTAFITTARRLAPSTKLPVQRKRNKPEYSDEDIEMWSPGSLGIGESTAKRARKAARRAEVASQRATKPPSAGDA